MKVVIYLLLQLGCFIFCWFNLWYTVINRVIYYALMLRFNFRTEKYSGVFIAITFFSFRYLESVSCCNSFFPVLSIFLTEALAVSSLSTFFSLFGESSIRITLCGSTLLFPLNILLILIVWPASMFSFTFRVKFSSVVFNAWRVARSWVSYSEYIEWLTNSACYKYTFLVNIILGWTLFILLYLEIVATCVSKKAS